MEQKVGKYTVKTEQDPSPESPRRWDNLGKMVCFHNRYDLGDKHDYNHKDYSGWDEMKKDIIKRENVAIILPLYLYDHSGITISTVSFNDRWDSGQVGFIFISKEKVLEEYGGKRVVSEKLDKARQVLMGEVETYDQYLTGDVYGFKIMDEDDNEIDSCWGFYGEEDCLKEGVANVPEEEEVS